MNGGSRIHLCGELRVEVGGASRAEELRGRQGRLALAFLVLHRGRPVARDEVVGALWPHDAAPPSETALAPVLSRLRRALAPATIEGRDAVQLVLPEPVWVDAEAAAQQLAAARAALRGDDPRQALAAAHDAAGLAAPGLLPGYDVPWLTAPRAELEDVRLEALEIAARAALLAGADALPDAERDARAAVAAAPFRESARALLVAVLAQRGNTAEAIRAYEEIRVLLREELGTVPGAELMALHERLIGSDSDAPAPIPARPAAPPRDDLLEREAELTQIATALARLAAGEGGALVFEGPAGIGKTRLLDTALGRAREAGALVLAARAGVMEREFGFGVVRQLFDARAMAELAGDAAGPARAVLGDAADARSGEGSFAVLDALFGVAASLAANRALVLCVDDLQWSDPASLRFVAYLTRRVRDLPILVAATIRSGEPGVDELLLGDITQDPATIALRPAPLTAEAIAGLVRTRLGAAADAAFTTACAEVTAGNPLLLGQLLTALAAESVAPDAEHADAVRAIGPRAVSRGVLLRLARLSPQARSVARAVALLGEQPALRAVARLAGHDEADVLDAIEALARAEILREDEPLGFVHPLVRDAIYLELPAARRGLEHARAARLLAELGASPERVAAQLMLAPARGDAWVVARLREAAAIAIERGAPDAALAHLERAHAEPPAPAERTAVAFELGAAAEFVRGSAAIEPLRRAHAGLQDPMARVEAALMLARMLLFMPTPEEAIEVIAAAQAELPAEETDMHDALVALRLVGVFFAVVDPSELAVIEEVRAGPRGSGPGARMMTAIAAMVTAVSSQPAAEAAALGREAMDDDTLLHFDRGIFCVAPAISVAMAEPADGNDLWRRIRSFAGRRGSVLDAVGADLWGGLACIWAGDLAEATLVLERSLEGEILFGSAVSTHMGYTPAFLSLAWLERGDLQRARTSLDLTGAHDGASDGARFWLASHGELLLAEGRHAEIAAIAAALRETRPPETHPLWSPWRSLLARAAAAAGDADTGLQLADEELALARRSGADWIVGRGLRLVGALQGAGGVAHLREAVVLLDRGSARLERAKAHAALGDALAAAGDEGGAAASRRTARRLAEQCAADGLAERLGAALGSAAGLGR